MQRQPEGDRRIEMSARDVTNRVRHRQDGQSKRECDAGKADSEAGVRAQRVQERGSEDGAFASTSEGVCCGGGPVEVASCCLRSLGVAAEGLDRGGPGRVHRALLEREAPLIPGLFAETMRRPEEP